MSETPTGRCSSRPLTLESYGASPTEKRRRQHTTKEVGLERTHLALSVPERLKSAKGRASERRSDRMSAWENPSAIWEKIPFVPERGRRFTLKARLDISGICSQSA